MNLLLVRTIDAKHVRDAEPSPKNASWTTPEEISAALGHLLSDEARVVNGARVPLFGAAMLVRRMPDNPGREGMMR